MFTGIIKEIGKIESVEQKENNKVFKVSASDFFTSKEIGASIAVDGVCLTLFEKSENTFKVEAIKETLDRTICGNYSVGDKVNLEGSLRVGDELSGHIVLGHVDRTSEVLSVKDDGGQRIIRIKIPPKTAQYIAFKGSVTINGASLTISHLEIDSFEVSLIPHTLDITNFSDLKKGSQVNIEIDTMARYAERLSQVGSQKSEFAYLVERGFI